MNTSDPMMTTRRASPGAQNARKVEPDREARTIHVLADETKRITDETFREMLMSCVLSGASDITIQGEQRVRAEIDGELLFVTKRAVSPSEADGILLAIYGTSSGRTQINGMKVLDPSYEISLADGGRQRFRVNVTGIMGRSGQEIEITIRALKKDTPSIEYVGLNEREVEAMTPRDGIAIVGGVTGSGKTTTLAAIMRHHLTNPHRTEKIVDIQEPIEFTYRDVTDGNGASPSIIGQSEVGTHVVSFAAGVHSALRRKPTIISVGEARDLETISASMEAANTGHLVYTTTHASSVAGSLRRLIGTFPGAERESRSYDLILSMRFVMIQSLVPRADRPGRVPVREYLKFTDRIRDSLLDAPLMSWPAMIQREVDGLVAATDEHDLRQSLRDVCLDYHARGMISRHDAMWFGKLLPKDFS